MNCKWIAMLLTACLLINATMLCGTGHAATLGSNEEPSYQLKIDLPPAPVGIDEQASLIWEMTSRALIAEARLAAAEKVWTSAKVEMRLRAILGIVCLSVGLVLGMGLVYLGALISNFE